MNLIRAAFLFTCYFCSTLCLAQLHGPGRVPAGTGATLQAAGSGSSILYIYGPGGAAKRTVQRGAINLPGEELQVAGRYIAIIDGNSVSFFVTPASLQNISFVARPSRVPAAAKGAVQGSAFLFDAFQNLYLPTTKVSFRLGTQGSAGEDRTVSSNQGVAWVQLDSGRRGGPADFAVYSEGASVRRIVQQVAADPCGIHMKALPASDGNILVETDPILDCAGNAVPDGTIVTFTSIDASGRSTVDARIKRGFASAELPSAPVATLLVAAGVVQGNEIHWGGVR